MGCHLPLPSAIAMNWDVRGCLDAGNADGAGTNRMTSSFWNFGIFKIFIFDFVVAMGRFACVGKFSGQ